VGFGPEVIFVPGPIVFHGLNVGFIVVLLVFWPLPRVTAAVVFIAIAVAADESSVSLLGCFGCAADMFAVMCVCWMHSCCHEYLIAACVVVFFHVVFCLRVCLCVGIAVGLERMVICKFVPIYFQTFLHWGELVSGGSCR